MINRLLFLSIFICLYSCGKGKKNPSKILEVTEQSKQIKETETIKNTELGLKEEISTIRVNFEEIEARLTSLENKKLEVDEGNWGTTELKVFYDGSFPVKIESSEVFGHSSIRTSYFLKEGKLFFVYELEYSEASIRGPFTDKQTRIYIKDEKVIRVLKKEKTSEKINDVDMTDVQNIDITKELENTSDLANNYIAKCSKRIKQLKEK